MYRALFVGVICQLAVGFPTTNLCQTDDCLYFAKYIQDKLNKSVEPCDDFYEFACGGLSNEIPNGGDEWGTIKSMRKDVKQDLIEIFEDAPGATNSTVAFKKFQRIYRNCMDLEAAERNGVSAILSHLRKSSGWPMMLAPNNWTEEGINLSQILAYHTGEMGFTPLFFLNAFPDSKNSSVNRLFIEPQYKTTFDQLLGAYRRNEPEILQFEQMIMRTVNVLANATGNMVNIDDLQKDITDMLDFAERAQDVAANSPYDPDKYELRSIRDFQVWYNGISTTHESKIMWNYLLREAAKYTSIPVTDDYLILVNTQSIAELVELMDAYSMRTIVNYIQWNFINTVLEAGPSKLRNIASTISSLKGNPQLERKELCVNKLSTHHAVGHHFVQVRFPEEKRIKMNAIISELIVSYNQLLNQTLWLKDSERQYAQDKLKVMSRLIGNPAWYGDSATVESFYGKFNINDNYVDNMIDITRIEHISGLKEIIKPQGRGESYLVPTAINAFYALPFNALLFPAAFLQRPVLGSNVPSSTQFGIIGGLAGHEMSHAFDPTGVKFDKSGNPFNWWSNETESLFNSKVGCFVDQYSNYTVFKGENTTVNMEGSVSKDETIADLHGLKASYAAYQRHKTLEDGRLRLPGLESYSGDQLFFLSYASFWCTANSESYLEHKAATADHPISRFRVIGTLSNMNEFSDAFNCPDTSKMNKPTKCAIWGTSH